ncbi:MAG: stage V sporulation protein AC [Clostridiales bacterium]|nr:stage V sporulation protein AC [Clostridiales bacterium]
MATTNKEYSKMAKKASPPSPKFKNMFFAFIIGGFICCMGEVLRFAFEKAGLNELEVKNAIPVTLIAITAFLTGIGVFDKIARVAGAGTIVPITGFANSVVSPAMEFKAEGKIMGTGVQMFTIAGPVIVYGTASAVLYGLIIYIFKLY